MKKTIFSTRPAVCSTSCKNEEGLPQKKTTEKTVGVIRKTATTEEMEKIFPNFSQIKGDRTPNHDGNWEYLLLKSPVIGTYYGSPSPGANAFVSIGSVVDNGQVVCIIESMKLKAEIKWDLGKATIYIIFKNDGDTVDYEENLFAGL